jgi:hypothetical protein
MLYPGWGSGNPYPGDAAAEKPFAREESRPWKNHYAGGITAQKEG